jgi:hypothetical protein
MIEEAWLTTSTRVHDRDLDLIIKVLLPGVPPVETFARKALFLTLNDLVSCLLDWWNTCSLAIQALITPITQMDWKTCSLAIKLSLFQLLRWIEIPVVLRCAINPFSLFTSELENSRSFNKSRCPRLTCTVHFRLSPRGGSYRSSFCFVILLVCLFFA